jgi:hypothetical protein
MLTKAELFKTNLFSNYPESAPAYTPKPLTDEEREQLITINMAESEDDEDCFSAQAAARRKAVDGRDAQRLMKLAKRGLL